MNEQIRQRIEQIRRGEVPAGYKKTKIGVIPSEWIYDSLEKYLIQHHETSDYSDQYPVLTSSRKGIYLQSDYYNHEVASEDNTGYNVVPRGYFTYRHMSDDEIFKFNINTIVDRGIVSTLYPVFTTKNIDDYFLQTVLNEGREFRRFAILQKQGGSRTYMYFDKLKKLKICLPPLVEQKKIAKILTTQDKLIALKEKLIEEKKRQKQALMQQLLTGKKRVPGFSGEWKTIKLSQISQKITEKNTDFQFNIVFSNSAQNGIIPQTEQFDKDIANDENIDKYYVVSEGCFVYNPRISVTAPCGPINVNHNTYTGVMSPLYTVFSVNSELIDNDYLEQYFKSTIWFRYMNSIANYGARHDRMSITDDDFFNMPIKVGGVDEQYAIKKILVAADNEIEFLQKDLDQEKQKKKALMQLLLTGIVRV